MRRALPLLAALAAATLLAGCTAGSYYWQAFSGQMEVRRLSRPVDEVIAAPDTAEDVRKRLEYARQARDFASAELHLPDNRSYRVYADLKRSYVVWNVFAAPPLSLTLETQCFPVAGCVSYRGYFSKDAAERYAAALRAQGLDVYSGGVPAYSTLGWFNDPLLNTFIRFPELELARLIFHELGHQVVYVKDDSTFNESFATAVEEEGLRRWMVGHATPDQKAQYEAFVGRREQMMNLLKGARDKLEKIYASGDTDAQKLAGKQKVLGDLQTDYASRKVAWGGFNGYDAWFSQDMNNAKLGSIATYTQRVPAFNALLKQDGGDLQRFYASVKALAALDKDERSRRLDALAAAAGPVASASAVGAQ
jgi:predicted aminopeptidase